MKKIAIIGAPNVGKSTFFNKLIGGRRSIVEDLPGVTRDRVYAEVNLARFHEKYNNLPVEIIDTGGLFFEKDSLFESVQKQAWLALEEADCIIFMVNARDGITSTDEQIAHVLQKANKPIILLANKLDSGDIEHLHAEFYQLGVGEPLPFSTTGSTYKDNFEKLVDRLIEHGLSTTKTKARKEDELPNLPKIALVGKPNTGKSSITNKLVGYERSLVHDQAGTTRDALDTFIKYYGKDLLLIDTAGLRRKTKITGDIERYSVDRSIKGIVRADIAVLVLDVTKEVSHQEQVLASLIQKKNTACVLVLNKWDLIDNKDYEANIDFVKTRLGFVDYAPVIVTSALTGQRVNNILEKCLEVYDNLNKKIKTNILNTALREITTLKRINSRLKIYYIVQTGVNPVSFTLFVNNPKYVDKNYLLFLERALREEFGFEGVPFKWDIRKSK